MFAIPASSPPEKLSREELAELANIQSSKFIFVLGMDMAIIALAVAVSEAFFFNPWIYLLAIIVIGSRIHAFGVLMHDATHSRGFKSRKLNTVVGELLAWTMLITLEGYRNNHLAHHRNLNTRADPDWMRKIDAKSFAFPKTKKALALELLKQGSGVGFLVLLGQVLRSKEIGDVSRRIKLIRLLFYVTVLAVCLVTGTLDKLALYWLVPLATTFNLIFYIRSVAEHHGNLEYDHTYTHARSLIPAFWEKFLFTPHYVGYHLEHHLYPHIPFYNLPKLHLALLKKEEFSSRAHITRGVITGLIKEFHASSRGPTPREIDALQSAFTPANN